MELKKDISGNIFDIQGFSVHDGPGARSLIFLKGCSLNCTWCSNPEGINRSVFPLYYSSKCIACGNCITACTHNAITSAKEKIIIDRHICEKCTDHSCCKNCFTDALKMSGRSISVDELFSVIQRDRQYWGIEGGVTLSGGEPLLQIDFVTELLEKCYHSYIHTAIETCGHVPWNYFKKTIGYLDWIFFDLKHLDPGKHLKETGQSNAKIIDNIKNLNKTYKGKLVFRFPLVPGFNSSKENIEATADLISETKWKEINILPLHHLGREKYELLGKEYEGKKYIQPTAKEIEEVKFLFEKRGIKCFAGHNTPF